MDDALMRAITARLDVDDALDDHSKLLVLAACEGERELGRALEGTATDEGLSGRHRGVAAQAEPAGAYLAAITVEGFRGIGPSATLELQPGPGLTVVVGRNGSGKSSFAEAIEFLLTGDNRRWTGRAVVWRDGWRNLHHEGPVTIEAELVVEGEMRRVTARCAWDSAAELATATRQLLRSGDAPAPITELGWADGLASFRPFLSYNELGSMLDEGPAKLYDAMSLILGLEDLVHAERALVQARKEREARHKEVRAHLENLLPRLQALDDDRARACHAALSRRTWDLDAVDRTVLAEAGTDGAEGTIQLLRQLATLEAPVAPEDVDALIAELRAAAAELAAVSGSDAATARETAALLQAALTFHEQHAGDDCPVCGASGALSAGWARRARDRVRELSDRASAAEQAHRREGAARNGALRRLTDAPACLRRAAEAQIDAGEALDAWRAWTSPPTRDDSAALAAHLEESFLELADAVARVCATAREHLDQRELAWRPMARELAAWVGDARSAVAVADQVSALKAAEKWLKGAAADLRNERFRPIADQARQVWSTLRTRSNVDLIDITLEGAGNRRRVLLDVRVDDKSGAALGVMSQGELHSLALSLFLPRATQPESPFRFLVVDDPVQSMDPARVDGLARVLDQVAQRRQVIVFTHDDRLPSAIRDLGIEARVVEVTRRAKSVVELRASIDPIARYLDDARSIVATDGLPEQVRRRLVPGFCREALEAACVESYRRRSLRAGAAHSDVEGRLAQAQSFTKLVALALFDDIERGGDVLPMINKRFKRWAGDVFKHCNKGSHLGHEGDLRDLVRGTEKLAAELRKL